MLPPAIRASVLLVQCGREHCEHSLHVSSGACRLDLMLIVTCCMILLEPITRIQHQLSLMGKFLGLGLIMLFSITPVRGT